jgi:hypothetical protein
MTDNPGRDQQLEMDLVDHELRHQYMRELKALNADLRRHGIEPLVSPRAAKTLDTDNMRSAVKATGDYLIDMARKLKGL